MRRIGLNIAFILVSLLLTAFRAAADQVDIEVNTPSDPSEVIGLVMSNDGTQQRIHTNWKRQSPGILTVSVPVTRADRKQGTVVTAMVTGTDGSVAFGNTKPAWIPELSPSAFEMKSCPLPAPPRDLAGHAGDIESLVENRSAQRSYLQLKIGNMLQGELLKKLTKLERGFGLEQGRPLDPSLPPQELQDRLARIQMAILSYRANKASVPPQHSSAESQAEQSDQESE